VTNPVAGPSTPGTPPSTASGSPTKRETAKLEQAARDFEAIFVNHLLKTMQPSGKGGIFPPSAGRQMYQDLMNEELSKTISRGRGIGLADTLIRDMTRLLPSEQKSSSTPRARSIAGPKHIAEPGGGPQ
jgi:Rod binding domain-containing protein